MPKSHVMLDLETLSTRKDAAIIQIAALEFDPLTGETGRSFNTFIRNPSGHLDVQTVAWWMQQAQAAAIGAALASPDSCGHDATAVSAFAEWLGNDTARGCKLEALWSHGATFDLVLLENAFNRNDMAKPWSYKVERDTRTLYALAPGGMPVVPTDPQRKHDARYDCEVQAKQVVAALAAVRYCVERAEALADTERATHDADGKPFNPEPCARVTPSATSECESGECDACQVARGEDPFNYAGIPCDRRPLA